MMLTTMKSKAPILQRAQEYGTVAVLCQEHINAVGKK
jgi:hypothetical protein